MAFYLFIFICKNIFFSFFFFYCCSSTVVSFSPHHSLSPQLSPPPTLNPTPGWFCPYVLYICSLTILSPIISSHLPSGYSHFVLYFNVSSYILLVCLFILLIVPLIGEIIWYLSFTTWLISLSIMLSTSIRAVAKGRSSLFLCCVVVHHVTPKFIAAQCTIVKCWK